MLNLCKKHFNSIKVQLKRGTIISSSGNIGFQFHKGTIKTTRRTRAKEGTGIFQFHKGTIKTISSTTL